MINDEKKVVLSELKREIDLLLQDTFVARFDCEESATKITFLNGQKFVVAIKEVK